MQDALHKRRITLELIAIVAGAIVVCLVVLPWLRSVGGAASPWRPGEGWGALEILALAAFLSVAFALFALDRWRDATRDRARLLAAEKALLESGAHYRLVFDHARDALILEDENERIVEANPAASELFGYTPAELLTMTTRELQPNPSEGPSFEIYAHPQEYRDLVTVTAGRRSDGADIPIEISMTAYDAGARKLFLSIVRDISERRQALEALRAERDRTQRYLDVAGVMLLVIEADERVSLINKRGAEVLGRPESEIVGQNWCDVFIPTRLRERVRCVFHDLLEGEVEQLEYHENAVLGADGREHMIAWHNVVLRDESGRGVGMLSSGEDVTMQRQLEEQLRQARKMEAIGQLAGGVAHEFNNLLQVINGYSEFALEALSADDPVRADVTEVRTAGERAAELTRQLLLFSRRQARRPRVIALGETLEGMGKMLRPLLGEDVSLSLRVADDLGSVRADAAQITQALINLAVNARDAIRATNAPGSIAIEATNAELDEPAALGLGLPAGDYVCVAVTDTGIGMSSQVLEHLFEPFFTTKRVGQGTGLGLSAVYGIVKQAGGGIGVRSVEGGGTSFALYLPRVRPRSGKQTQRAPRAALQRGDETILVVEDDEGVRELARRLLGKLGYAVFEARSAEEALELCQARGQSPALLLTDVLLPNKTGPELVEELHRRGCTCRVLYMSGHAPETLGADLAKASPLLTKPFTMEQLAHHLRQVLDATA